MKYCNNCGASNDDKALFCRSCNEKLPEQETIIKYNPEPEQQIDYNTYNNLNIPKTTKTLANLSSGWVIFWAIVACILPSIGAIVSCMIYGKDSSRQAYLIRLWTGIGIVGKVGYIVAIIVLLFCAFIAF